MSTTLPGSIPGLLRPGSPVFCHGIKAMIIAPDTALPEDRHGEWTVASAEDWPDFGATHYSALPRSVRSDECQLDLSDPMGQQAAISWLVAHASHPAIVLGKYPPPTHMLGGAWYWHRGLSGWALIGGGWTTSFDTGEDPRLVQSCDPIEALRISCEITAARGPLAG